MKCGYVTVLLAVAIAAAVSSPASAKDRPRQMTPDEMIYKILRAQKKQKTLEVTFKDGTKKWGLAVDISRAYFKLWDGSRTSADLSIAYKEVVSVRYETGWDKFVRGVRDSLTAPIVAPVFIIWGLQGHRC